MIRKILVPIAFSPLSRELVGYAASLAGQLGAEMFLVNVINDRDLEAVDRIASYGYDVDKDQYLDTLKKERLEFFEGIIKEHEIPVRQFSCTFRVGDPASELLHIVVEEEIDMVVMGVKSRDIRHIFTGSVAERLFRKCPCTIVSFRDDDTAERLSKRIQK